MSGGQESGEIFEGSGPDEATLNAMSGEEFCYLTTTGRITKRPHEIEIWFALVPERKVLFMMSGSRERSDWVKNLIQEPKVSVRIAGSTLRGRASLIEGKPEDPTAREMLVEKYELIPGGLSEWRKNSLPVAVDLA